MDKAEADRHDKMLELAEMLAVTLQSGVPGLGEQHAEEVSIFMARNREIFAKAFKSNPEVLQALTEPSGD